MTCLWWATAALAFHPRVRLLRTSCAPQGRSCTQRPLNISTYRYPLAHTWTDTRIVRQSKRPGCCSALLKQQISCSCQSFCLSTISHLNKVTFDPRVPPKTVEESAQRNLWLHYQWVRKQLSSGFFDFKIPVVISSSFERDGQLPQHVPSETCQLALKHKRRRQMFDSETQITHFWFEGCKLQQQSGIRSDFDLQQSSLRSPRTSECVKQSDAAEKCWKLQLCSTVQSHPKCP